MLKVLLDFFKPVILFLFLNLHGAIFQNAFAWNFSDVGLPQDVLIWRFTIWRNRAYLAVPRWDQNSKKLPFTLLEAPWPETSNSLQFSVIISIPEVLPYPDAKSQEEGICQHLQSVTGLDSDSRGRLWVLDAPTRYDQCKAKILIFDLRRNEKVSETELQGVSPRHLKCLVVDPVVGHWGFQAYVSDPGDETIIVYSHAQRNWWRLKLSREFNTPNRFITDLAISRKSSVMYLTGYPSHDLFSIDLESIRNDEGTSFVSSKNNNESLSPTSVSWVGSKMGSSSGLINDLRGGLHYFLVTEIASVRWDTKQKLEIEAGTIMIGGSISIVSVSYIYYVTFKAEVQAILLQSELVPCITDYAFDSQKNVWGIVNDRYPFRNVTKNNREHWKNSKIQRRTVKVYKYNPFIL